MPEVVVQNAQLICTAQSTPSVLTVTSQAKTSATSQLVGTINDNSLANIGTFGICSILTAQAGGTPTPCSPNIPSTWAPGSTKITCNSKKCLLVTDTLACAVGGTISISSAGQTKVTGI